MVRRLALLFVAACGTQATSPDAMRIGPWIEGTELPTPRLEPGVTALGQRLVVLGGFDTNVSGGLHITNEVLEFDPFTSTWDTLHPAPVSWTHAQLAAVSATLYLLGGAETQEFIPSPSAYALDTATPGAEWRALAPMPAGLERTAAGIVISPPHIYLLGGANATDAVATCLDYNLSTDEWTMIPSLPEKRSHPAAMRKPDGTLIVAGGLAGLDAQTATDDVFALPQNATEWIHLGKMLAPLGGCAYGVVMGQLICAGGESGQAALSTTYAYDPIGNVWTVKTPMPAPRAGTQGAVISGKLYVPGGAEQLVFQPERTLFIYSLVDDPIPAQ